MTTTIFSLIGFEAVSITAPENKDRERQETIKLATRKTALRIIPLYTFAIFCVGLNVPYTDSNLGSNQINGVSGGEHSIFIIAAVYDHVRGFPSFFNAFFIFCATSAGLNSLYISSRLLHALANVADVWYPWGFLQTIRRGLAHTSSGVPRWAVFVSSLFGLLGFLATTNNTNVVS